MEQQQTYQLQTKPKHQLPTLEELHHDLELAGKNDALNQILNTDPPDRWLKTHPFVNVKVMRDGKEVSVGLRYLPIEKVKFLLIRIFQGYKVTVKSVTQLFNSVCVTVTVTVTNPITGEEMSNDGIGAVGVQTDKGATAADMSMIKFDGVMKAAPAAESYAIHDAAKKFGKIFGGDIMKDQIPFAPTYDKGIDYDDLVELYDLKKESLTDADRTNAERIISTKEVKSYSKLHRQLSAL
jgi:hypothetical protein